MEQPTYRREEVVLNVPPDVDKLAVSFKLCDTCKKLFPEDDLETGANGHGRCMSCWQKTGRSYEQMLAAGELSPEEIAA